MIGLYRRPWPRAQGIGVAHQSPGAPAPPNPPFRYDFFVSPSGGTGAGSFESPWSYEFARSGAGGLIVPPASVPNLGYLGIGIRGGQYLRGTTASWANAGAKRGGLDDADGKIIYRNYNGEHVEWINDSASKSIENIHIAGPYQWFWGIDAWRKHTDRYNYPGPGTNWYIRNTCTNGGKLIHCWGHEGSNSYFSDSAYGNFELYGCGSFHAGVSVDPRAHGFYFHHTRDSGETGSRLLLTEHISFNHLGNCGQIFASSAPEQLDDIDILGLIAWHGGRIANTTGQQNLTFAGTDGSNIPLRGFTGKFIISWNPIGYGRACIRFYGGGGATNQSAVLEDSYLVGGKVGEGVGRLTVEQMHWASFAARRNTMVNLEQTQLVSTVDDTGQYGPYTWEANVYYGSDPTATRWRAGPTFVDRTFAAWKAFTGLGATDVANASLPSTTVVFQRPVNKYEYGRGHVCYFNYASLSRIPVDLSSFLAVGDRFVVRNAQASSPERNPGTTVQVYDAPSGGNVVDTWLGSTVYFPTTGVTPPTPYGFNNPTLDGWVNPAPTTAPFFDLFIVSTT